MLSRETNSIPEDRSRRVLHVLHRALADEARSLGLPELLGELAGALGAVRAGVARLDDGQPLVEVPTPTTGPAPWQDAELLRRARTTWGALAVPGEAGWFLAGAVHSPLGEGWLLWTELQRTPTDAERAALALAAQALQGWGVADAERPRWLAQLRKAQLEQQLERAAGVVRRLAHDYGNVLTSILGFTELGLGQGSRDTALQRYLQEVYRGAEQGAQLTNRLRLFARRVSQTPVRPLSLATALNEEQRRLLVDWPARIALVFDIPDDLPMAALSSEGLHEVLGGLLENAREAIPATGQVTVTARARHLEPLHCLDVLGPLPPGPCVEVTVADTGVGLAPEVRDRLFRELFYSSKPRHRGLGLFAVYGLLSTHRGGLALGPGPTGGTVARFYLPAVPALVRDWNARDEARTLDHPLRQPLVFPAR